MSSPELSVSVVICAHSDLRREQLDRAIASVTAQSFRDFELIVVIDHNPALLRSVVLAHPGHKVIASEGPKGLSGARNTGIAAARGAVVAFLDDDAAADRDWLDRILAHYSDPQVMGVGGRITPKWVAFRPKWLPEEFNWVVGCSYLGQPDKVTAVRNPFGANMSFRRTLFNAIGGFRDGIGRSGNDAAGCEETELCIRARQSFPSAVILYEPRASVQHEVAAERSAWSYFRRRCLAEGRSKTLVVSAVGSRDGLSAERTYVRRVLPLGVLNGLRDAAFRLDPWGLARAAAIFAGLGYTAYGYFGAKLAMGART